jgi:HEAT repeat protein
MQRPSRVAAGSAGYEEKLVQAALHHPIADHQMIAIRTLGELGSEAALPAFTALLASDSDIYICREVVRALARIGTPDSRRVLERAAHHAATPVAHLAQELLAGDRTTIRGDAV